MASICIHTYGYWKTDNILGLRYKSTTTEPAPSKSSNYVVVEYYELLSTLWWLYPLLSLLDAALTRKAGNPSV